MGPVSVTVTVPREAPPVVVAGQWWASRARPVGPTFDHTYLAMQDTSD